MDDLLERSDWAIEPVEIKHLKEHPKNPNKHSSEQIERLAEIIQYQGFKQPILISRQSGFIVAGHGRLAAAKKLKMTELPCLYVDFRDESEEYAFLSSDNAIASWAQLDFSKINAELPNLGPDFDLNLLGIKDFKLDISEKEIEEFKDFDQKQEYLLVINCENEPELQRLYERFSTEGLNCKIIT